MKTYDVPIMKRRKILNTQKARLDVENIDPGDKG